MNIVAVIVLAGWAFTFYETRLQGSSKGFVPLTAVVSSVALAVLTLVR